MSTMIVIKRSRIVEGAGYLVRRKHLIIAFRPALHLLLAIGIVLGPLPLSLLLPANTPLSPKAVEAATFTVTKTADTADGACDSDCSLREAIIAANASLGSDTITLPSGTYNLIIPGVAGFDDVDPAIGDLDLKSGITLAGAGPSVTIIDASAIGTRTFDIPAALATTVGDITFTELTITGGNTTDLAGADNAGGAIRADSVVPSVFLDEVVIDGNISGSAIYTAANLNITNSSIRNNTGDGLLATCNGATSSFNRLTTIKTSTISVNTGVGALARSPGTGCIPSLSLTNSTISGNTGMGGLQVLGAVANLLNVTIFDHDNGHGIRPETSSSTDPQVNVKNTIVAQSGLGSCPTTSEVSGAKAITSGGNNLFDDADCNSISSDKTNTSPGLNSVLTNNGGATSTHALQSGSAAIDAANDAACPATDQRGQSRPADGDSNGSQICDMGAYEFVPAPGTIQFSAATYSASEGAGTVSVTLTRTDGTDGEVSVTAATSDGTATQGSDYTSTSNSVIWANGVGGSKTFGITLLEDSTIEGSETVNLAISSPTGGAILGPQTSAVLTITDNEAGTLQFSSATYSVAENATTSAATISVTRTEGSDGAVSITGATATGGTATAGADYASTSTTLSWADGVSGAKTFTIPINNDADFEGNETVNLALSSVTGGATLGPESTAVLTITDDEESPPGEVFVLDSTPSSADQCSSSVGPHSTIAAAISAASSGKTILVCPAIYKESVTIPASKDNITIMGAGNISPMNDSFVPDPAAHSIIDVSTACSAAACDTGILVDGADGTTVKGLVVTGAESAGIDTAGTASPAGLTVHGNAIVGNDWFGIDANALGGGALSIASNLIMNNTGPGVGASFVCGVTSVAIDNNVVIDNGYKGISAREMGYTPECGPDSAIAAVSISGNTIISNEIAAFGGALTQSGNFNNTADPVVVGYSTYGSALFLNGATVGALIRIEDEIMRVAAVDESAGTVSLARGQKGTTNAAHGDGLPIYAEAAAIDAYYLNSGPTLSSNPPQTGTVVSVNIDNNNVTGTGGPFSGINAGYLMGNFSAQEGNTSSVGTVSISGNTINGGGHLHIPELLRYFGYADSCSSGSRFHDVGTLSLGTLKVNDNTINDGDMNGLGTLHATYVLQYAGNINASCASASVDGLTIGGIQVSSNSLDGGMIDVSGLLAMSSTDHPMIYASAFSATLGNVSIGAVKINENQMSGGGSLVASTNPGLALLSGFGGVYASGTTVTTGTLSLDAVNLNGNQVESGSIVAVSMLDRVGKIEAYNSTITVTGKFDIGPVKINANAIEGGTLHITNIGYDAFNIYAGSSPSTVQLAGVDFDGLQVNGNTLTNAAVLEAGNAFYHLLYVSSLNSGDVISIGPVSIGGFSISNNSIAAPGYIDLNSGLYYAFRLDARNGATSSISGVSVGDIAINANTGADFIDAEHIMYNAFSVYASGTGSEAQLGTADGVTLGAMSISNNAVPDGYINAQYWLAGGESVSAFGAQAYDGGSASFGNVTLDGIQVNNNTLGTAEAGIPSGYGELNIRYALRNFGTQYASGGTTSMGNVSIGDFTMSDNTLVGPDPTFDLSGSIEAWSMLEEAFQMDAHSTASLGNVTTGMILIDGNTFVGGGGLDACCILEDIFDLRADANSDSVADTDPMASINIGNISIGPSQVTNNTVGNNADIEICCVLEDMLYVGNYGSITVGTITVGEVLITGNILGDSSELDACCVLEAPVEIDHRSSGSTTIGAVSFGNFTVTNNLLGDSSDLEVCCLLEDPFDIFSNGSGTATVGNMSFGQTTVNNNTLGNDSELDACCILLEPLVIDNNGTGTVQVGNLTIGMTQINNNMLRDDSELDACCVFLEPFIIDNTGSGASRTGDLTIGQTQINNNSLGKDGEIEACCVLQQPVVTYNKSGSIQIGNVAIGQIELSSNTIGVLNPETGVLEFADELEACCILESALNIRDFSADSTAVGAVNISGLSINNNKIGTEGELDACCVGDDFVDLEAGAPEGYFCPTGAWWCAPAPSPAVSGSITIGNVAVGPIEAKNNTLYGGDLEACCIFDSTANVTISGSPTDTSTVSIGTLTYGALGITDNTINGGELDVCCIGENALNIGGNAPGQVTMGAVSFGAINVLDNDLANTDYDGISACCIFLDAAMSGGTVEPTGSVPSVVFGPVNLTGNTLTGTAGDPAGMLDLSDIESNVGFGFGAPNFSITGSVTVQDITVQGNAILYGANDSPVMDAGSIQYTDNGSHVTFGDVNITQNTIQFGDGDGLRVGGTDGHTKNDVNVTRNTISNNSTYGITIDYPGTTTEVHQNNIYCNRGDCTALQALEDSSSNAQWTGTDPVLGTNTGNYWGTDFYAAFDITDGDNNGIGDTGGPNGDTNGDFVPDCGPTSGALDAFCGAPIAPALEGGTVWSHFDELPVMTLNGWQPTVLELIKVSGDFQSGSINAALSSPFVAQVRDHTGDPVAGATVEFSILAFPGSATSTTADDATGQSISTVTAVSNSAGRAGTILTFGDKAGVYKVKALSGSISPVEFTATARAATITGTASKADGSRVINAQLIATEAVAGGARQLTTKTDGGGNYTLAVNGGSQWRIKAFTQGLGSAFVDLDADGVADIVNANSTGQNIVFAETFEVGGVVTVNSSPSQGAIITAVPVGTAPAAGNTTTNSAGAYTLSIQRPLEGSTFTYQLSASISGAGSGFSRQITIDSTGAITPSATQNFTLSTNTITFNFSEAVPSAVISASSNPIAQASITNASSGSLVVISADSEAGKSSVTYAVKAVVSNSANLAISPTSITASGAGTAHTVTVTLPPPADLVTIGGIITSEDSGVPIAGATVNGISTKGFSRSIKTGLDGAYTLTFPSGRQAIQLSYAKTGFISNSHSLTTSSNQTVNKTLKSIAPITPTISGQIMLEGGPFPEDIPVNVTVTNESDGKSIIVPVGATSAACATDKVASNTHYCVPVSSGKWAVRATADDYKTQDEGTATISGSSISGINVDMEATASAEIVLQECLAEDGCTFSNGSVTLILPPGAAGTGLIRITIDETADSPITTALQSLLETVGGDPSSLDFAIKDSDGDEITEFDPAITIIIEGNFGGRAVGVGFIDPETGEWVILSTCVIETDRAICTTTHLTKFAVLSSRISAPSPGPGGGETGGGGNSGALPIDAQPQQPAGPAPLIPTTTSIVDSGTGGKVMAGNLVIDVPPGATSGGGPLILGVSQLTLTPSGFTSVQQSSVPLPSGSFFGSASFEITAKDSQGVPFSQFRTPLHLTLKYTDADVAKALGAGGLRLLRYDSLTTTWVDLKATVDPATSTLAGDSAVPGVFALLIKLPVPVPVYPVDFDLTGNLGPALSWASPSGTTQYHIQIVPANNDGPGIDLIIGDAAMVALASYQVQPPKLGTGNYVMLPGMGYTWKVRTSSETKALGAGDPGWSDFAGGSFRTQLPLSSYLTPVSPGIGATVESLTPAVAWANTFDHIFYYEVQLSADPGFNNDRATAVAPVFWELVHGGHSQPLNSYQVRAGYPLQPATTYYWRVRPRVQGDGPAEGVAWSDTWSFNTP